MYDLTLNGVYPADVYEHPEWYFAHHESDLEAWAKIASVRGRPNARVVIYRAVPRGVRTFYPGDWVTITRRYAMDHGWAVGQFDESENMPVIAKRVPASVIYTDGNSMLEWGYVGPEVDGWFSYRPRSTRR